VERVLAASRKIDPIPSIRALVFSSVRRKLFLVAKANQRKPVFTHLDLSLILKPASEEMHDTVLQLDQLKEYLDSPNT
jgi:hypothetical protein